MDELRGERVVLLSVLPEDAAAVVAAFNGDEAFNRLSGGEAILTEDAVRAEILETLSMPGGAVWRIDTVDGELIGVVETAQVPPPNNAWIALLIITKVLQRQGYGSEVADLIERQCFADPAVTAIGLGVLTTNIAAQAFWEHRGYTRRLKRRDNHGNEIYTYRLDRPAAMTDVDDADRQLERDAQIERVRSQFGPAAAAYAASSGHARGDELARIVEIAGHLPSRDSALDVATGAGHTAFAIAPYFNIVIATDVTDSMLAETARGATARNLDRVTTAIADAHALPYPDHSFDLVTSRIAPHHFMALPLAMREMVRVTRPGGMVLIVDSVVPDDPELDGFLNRAERLRDPSHIRSLTEPEWRQLFLDAGLQVIAVERYAHTHDYADWVARANVAPRTQPKLERMFLEADAKTKAAFDIRVEHDHVVSYQDEKLLIAGVRLS